MTIVSASLTPHPTVTYSMRVPASLANANGFMHGGAYSLVFDCLTTVPLALLARDGFWRMGGVSRTLNVCYLMGVAVGESVVF